MVENQKIPRPEPEERGNRARVEQELERRVKEDKELHGEADDEDDDTE